MSEAQLHISCVRHTRFPQDSKTRSQHLITSSTSGSLKRRLRRRRIHVPVEEREERRMRVLELLPSSTSYERKSIAHVTTRAKFNDQPVPNSTALHITSISNHGNLVFHYQKELLSTLEILQVLSHECQINTIEDYISVVKLLVHKGAKVDPKIMRFRATPMGQTKTIKQQ
ncbi:uncharacterized protein Bfra_007922 [Botrytis fragariae]|uniref:Uncharacterized protein n=1 Tax=Botrytis fragariae TaxID=1964551 RepID=A0A8H6APG7_9HELO|nr:uncharacterized protein Bfra_007922 [Botrytis fragariae]KAF5871406.1 hypothetical protein Bfra_007922 [Botrytis fragariae]